MHKDHDFSISYPRIRMAGFIRLQSEQMFYEPRPEPGLPQTVNTVCLKQRTRPNSNSEHGIPQIVNTAYLKQRIRPTSNGESGLPQRVDTVYLSEPGLPQRVKPAYRKQ